MDPDKIEDGDEGAGDGKPDSLMDELSSNYDQLADGADAEEGDGKPDADEGSDDGGSQEQEAADAETGEVEDDEQEAVELEAPEHWSNEDKEAFAALPDEAKPLALDWRKSIEAGYDTKFQELAADRKKIEPYQGFDDVFAPYRHELDRQGLTPEAYVRQLMAVATDLQNDPASTLQRLAQTYGVDFGQAQADEAGEDEFLDPAAAARIRELENQLAQFQSQTTDSLNQLTQANTTASQQHYLDTFNAFAKEHAHADRLRTQIGFHLQNLTPDEQAGKTMDDMLLMAYERAAWADPDARADLIAAQNKPKDGEPAKGDGQMKAQVQKAKKAGRVARSKSDGAAQVPEARSAAGSWREGVEAVMAELEAR